MAEGETAHDAVAEIEENLQGLFSHATGMGLYMIREIAKMCYIETELRLFDRTKKLIELKSYKRLDLPFCLLLSWEAKDERD